MKKLFWLLLTVMLLLPAKVFAQDVTLTGVINNPDGSGFNGTLYLQFEAQVSVSSTSPCTGPAFVTGTPNATPIAIKIVNGSMVNPPKIYGSTCVSPYGMPYIVTLRDTNGNVVFTDQWLIIGPTQNIGDITPTSALPPSPNQYITGLGTSGISACFTSSTTIGNCANTGGYVLLNPPNSQTIAQQSTAGIPLEISDMQNSTVPILRLNYNTANEYMQFGTVSGVTGSGSDLSELLSFESPYSYSSIIANRGLRIRAGYDLLTTASPEVMLLENGAGTAADSGDIDLIAGVEGFNNQLYGANFVNTINTYTSSTGTALAAGTVVCMGGGTGNYDVQACTSSTGQVVGVVPPTPTDAGGTLGAVQFVQVTGIVSATLDATGNIAVGDYLCTSSTAGTVHDNGATACTTEQVGYAAAAGTGVTSATLALYMGGSGGGGGGGSGSWSALTNPGANLALSMGSYTTTFTAGAATGTADLFKWTDTVSNTGTGILGHFTTASGSTEIPWEADANGCGWEVAATTGALTGNCTTQPAQITLTYVSGHPPTAGSATSAVLAPDAYGNMDMIEAGGAAARICDATNGVCAASPSTTPTGTNTLLSGGGVVWTGGLNFTISAATYDIAATQYTSPQTNVTLAAADPTNPRIDVFYVDNTGTAGVITGTPSATPAVPSIDPTSQLELGFVEVPAASSTPSVTQDSIYLENTEWTCTASADFNCASTSNPYQGTYDIEATSAVSGNNVGLVKPSSGTDNLSNFSGLSFYILNKASWPSSKSVTFTWYNGATVVGTAVALKSGVYGFNGSNTTTYQQIVIPTSAFATGSNLVTTLQIAVTGGGGSIGFYLDNIILQDNLNGGGNGGTGTVTSVGMTVPSWLSVAGSPITTSGTLAVTAAGGQTANEFLATPNGTAGAVGLRTIVGGDFAGLSGCATSGNLFSPANNDCVAGGGGGTGLSGMTAGQVPIAATATTVTSSKALAGTGVGITTGPTTTTLNDCVKFGDTAGTIADAGAACGSGGGPANIIYLAAPVQPPGAITATPSTTGGTLAAATYYIVVTSTNGTGQTIGSAEASVTTTGTTSSIATSWTAVTGATGYKVYVGTTSGSEGQYFTTATNSYTVTTATGTAGTVPTINTTADMGSEFNTAETTLLSDIPAGGVIVFPAGSSNIATPAIITSNTISAVGYGVQATNLTCTVQGDCLSVIGAYTQYKQKSGAISGFTINGDSALTVLSAPGTVTPTASTTGGTLATATYYYKVTAATASSPYAAGSKVPSGQTTASTEASVSVTGPTGSVGLSWTAVSGAAGYYVYRGTSSGGENLYYFTSTNSFTDTGSTGTTGTVPTANTTNQVLLHHYDAKGWTESQIFLTGANNTYAVCDEYENLSFNDPTQVYGGWTEGNVARVDFHANSAGNQCLDSVLLEQDAGSSTNSFGYNTLTFFINPSTSSQNGVVMDGSGELYNGILRLIGSLNGGSAIVGQNGFSANNNNSQDGDTLDINLEGSGTVFNWTGAIAFFTGQINTDGPAFGTAVSNVYFTGPFSMTGGGKVGGAYTSSTPQISSSGIPWYVQNTSAANNVNAAYYLAPNLTSGTPGFCKYYGVGLANNNTAMYCFVYTSTGSTSNKFTLTFFGQNTATPTFQGNALGDVTVYHHYYVLGTPSIAAGTGAGTGPTLTRTGNDEAGVINLTTGTSPTASAVVATTTLGNACTTGISVSLTPADATAATLSGSGQVWAVGTAAGTWTINANTTALAASTAYEWAYHARCY